MDSRAWEASGKIAFGTRPYIMALDGALDFVCLRFHPDNPRVALTRTWPLASHKPNGTFLGTPTGEICPEAHYVVFTRSLAG